MCVVRSVRGARVRTACGQTMSDNVRATGGAVHRKQTNLPILRLEHIAQNHQIIGQLQVESLRKFHHFWTGQLRGSSMRSLLKIGLILQCFKWVNEDQHWSTDLSELQKSTKGFSIENLSEQMTESSIFRIPWDPISSKELRVFFFWWSYQFIRASRGNIEIVKWIGKFSLLLKRSRDARMDMLPVSVMSEDRRENQYLADVTQETA